MLFNFNSNMNNMNNVNNQVNLITTFRRLWEQHIWWTRSLIISTLNELDDLPSVTERLLHNPNDFAVVLRNFYGIENAKKFDFLLTEHLLIAESMLNNLKSGKTEEFNQDKRKWYANSDDISIFLSNLNPNWPVRQLQSLFYDHLKTTEDMIVLRMNDKYSVDVAHYDSVETRALKIADTMSYGIINQLTNRNNNRN
jgi:hypothetical protein